ncbi:MAG: hypothetical protein U1F65_08820 [Verrucomicrobiota bacterium]
MDGASEKSKNANQGQFSRLLRSLAEASYKSGSNSVSHPPDNILHAYADLLCQVFVYQRCMAVSKNANLQELSDLADALHNVGKIFVHYDVNLNDEKYRKLYLRPFDERWSHEGFGLEQFLESRLSVYSKG